MQPIDASGVGERYGCGANLDLEPILGPPRSRGRRRKRQFRGVPDTAFRVRALSLPGARCVRSRTVSGCLFPHPQFSPLARLRDGC